MHRHAVDLGLEDRSILALRLGLRLQAVAGARGLEERPAAQVTVRVHELERLDRQQLLARVTLQAAECRVRVHDAPVGRAQGDPVDGGVEGRVIALLARAQRLFGGLALGDVGGDAAHGIGLALGVVQRELERQVGAHAVFLRHLLLELDGCIALEHERVVAVQVRGDLGRENFRVGAPDDLARAPAEQLQEQAVGELIAAVTILDVHHGGGVVENLLQDEDAVVVARHRRHERFGLRGHG